jgi:hypothetical protein
MTLSSSLSALVFILLQLSHLLFCVFSGLLFPVIVLFHTPIHDYGGYFRNGPAR